MKRFALIMGCVVWTIFLLSCREDPLPVRDNLKVTAEIRLKTLLNFKEVRDGYVVSSFHIFNRLAGSLINTTQPIEKNIIYQRNNIN